MNSEKKILFLCNQYGTSTSANGICIRNIAQEMKRQGHTVYVVSDYIEGGTVYDVIDGIHVYRIYEAWSYRMLKRYQRETNRIIRMGIRCALLVKNMLMIPFYPNVAPLGSMQMHQKAKELIEKHGITTVIGVYRPYEGIFAAVKLKENFGDKIKVITYHLDLIQSPANEHSFIRKYKIERGKVAIKREFSCVDKVVLPRSAKEQWGNSKNVFFADFPLYLKNVAEEPHSFSFSDEDINITYVGSLDRSNRNPKSILELIEQIPEIAGKKVKLHFWGGLSDKTVEEMIRNCKCAQYHGIIENKYVSSILKRSDFLLNVSNYVTYDMVPSKIFQMFSTKKPIINLLHHKRDAALYYFEEYGGACNFFAEDEDVEKKLEQFIKEHLGKEIDDSEGKFYRSTPEYTVELMLRE